METKKLNDDFMQRIVDRKIMVCEKLQQRLAMVLCIFVVTQLSMLLILNLNLPLECEWASVCKEWIKGVIG